MNSGTSSVVPAQTIKSDASGFWSINLVPAASLVPAGTSYTVTRTYPRKYGGEVNISYIIVPPTGPVNFNSIVSSTPQAEPLSETELAYLLAHPDPFPQYLTQTEGDTRYGIGGGGSGPVDHTAITDWDAALAAKRLDQFTAPNTDLSVASHKITNLTKGTSSSDAASVQNITDHTGASDPHPQYQTSAEVSAQIAAEAPAGSGSIPDATSTVKGKLQLAGDLAGSGSSSASPKVALGGHSVSELGVPTADIPWGSRKITSLNTAATPANTDAANAGYVNTVAGTKLTVKAGGFNRWVQESAPTTGMADGDEWIQKSNAVLHIYNGTASAWIAAPGSGSKTTFLQATDPDPSNPNVGDFTVRLV